MDWVQEVLGCHWVGHVLFVVLQISLPVWLYLSCPTHLQCLLQYLLAICKYRGRRPV